MLNRLGLLLVLACAFIVVGTPLLGPFASSVTRTLASRASHGSCPRLAIPASRLGEDHVVGPPTITLCLITQVLVHSHSPARGAGQAVYDDGVKYGLDPVFALAFFMHESGFGTAGEARVSRSIGNLRCLGAGYEDLHPRCQDSYAWFPRWDDGIEAWYRLIKVGYVQGRINAFIGRNTCPCVTVAQIIPVYAPRADNNNEVAYIAAVEQEVHAWRSGEVGVTP